MNPSAETPLLTVCIPTIGTSPFLRETLASVKAAWRDGLELAIFDNASKPSIPRGLLDEVGLSGRVIRSETRLELAKSWNHAVSLAQTTWIHILHDDDCVEPGFYSVAFEAIRKYPGIGIWFCGTREVCTAAVEEEIEVVPLVSGAVQSARECARLLFLDQISRCVSTVLNTNTVREAGGFDPAMRHNLDLDLFWRCAKVSGAFFEPRVLGRYRAHPFSLSQWTGRGKRKAPVEDGRVFHDTCMLLAKHSQSPECTDALQTYAGNLFRGMRTYHLHRLQMLSAMRCHRALKAMRTASSGES